VQRCMRDEPADSHLTLAPGAGRSPPTSTAGMLLSTRLLQLAGLILRMRDRLLQ
jgi:hypothetical protein